MEEDGNTNARMLERNDGERRGEAREKIGETGRRGGGQGRKHRARKRDTETVATQKESAEEALTKKHIRNLLFSR